ncbi:MAG: RIP metalloprotease RseP [Terracidiphilus sp.]|jgi:regulator of sigma E protease
MQNLHTVVIDVVAFIVLVGVMVVVHEFGHFAVAKLFGVRVEAFSFGFGPRLFGFKYGDTDYKVCLLPLGGFVKMTGEAPEQNLEAPGASTAELPDDPGSLLAHPRWQRMLIGFAGPFSNFILAFVLMVFYFNFINEVPNVHPIVVEWVAEGSAAAQAGIEPGDIISRFDTNDNPTWEQIRIAASENVSRTVPVTVQRGGKTIPLALRLSNETNGKKMNMEQAGLFIQLVQTPIKVDSVAPNAPAAQAGLRGDDLILALDGHAFHTLEPFVAYLQAGHGKPVTLSVSRNGQTIAPLVVHPWLQDSTWRLGFSYVPPPDPPTQREPLPFSKSLVESKDFCADSSVLIFGMLKQLFTHKASVSQLIGPVGIARAAGEAAETKDWSSKFGLAASISLNLGVLNLLPFPILDGGMIFILLIESLWRRDIDIDVKERIYQAAFVVIVAFFAFVIFNDVSKIFTHLKP